MHDNTTRRGLGVAIFIVAILGIAAVGAAYLLVSKVGRAGGVANDPAYVAAMSYAGPATDVAAEAPGDEVASKGTDVQPTPDPGTDAPLIDEWDAATFEAGSPLGEMERTLPPLENGGTAGEVGSWVE